MQYSVRNLVLSMEKTPLKIKLEDLPENIDDLPEDTIVIIDDYDEMAYDDFWEDK